MLKMHETCPVCGIIYEREHGFFMMAIFVGYILGLIITVPAVIVLYLLDASIPAYFIGAALVLLPASPFIFRYSRIIWLHLDEMLDPRSNLLP